VENESDDQVRVQVPLPLSVDIKEVAKASRMLNRYLCDIVDLLRVGEHAQAVGAAVLLPRIATALSDPHLQTSGKRVEEWCQGWLEQGPWREQRELIDGESPERSPVEALRALRLRRHARPSPLGVKAPHFSESHPADESQSALCFALVRASSAWYAQEGARNALVQSNLARLAVLR
jgi:hypothetical protein